MIGQAAHRQPTRGVERRGLDAVARPQVVEGLAGVPHGASGPREKTVGQPLTRISQRRAPYDAKRLGLLPNQQAKGEDLEAEMKRLADSFRASVAPGSIWRVGGESHGGTQSVAVSLRIAGQAARSRAGWICEAEKGKEARQGSAGSDASRGHVGDAEERVGRALWLVWGTRDPSGFLPALRHSCSADPQAATMLDLSRRRGSILLLCYDDAKILLCQPRMPKRRRRQLPAPFARCGDASGPQGAFA